MGTSTAIPYLELVIQFSLSVYALHTYLDLRQLKVTHADTKSEVLYRPLIASGDLPILQALKRTSPPPQLADHLTKEQYKKAQAYNIDKWCTALV